MQDVWKQACIVNLNDTCTCAHVSVMNNGGHAHCDGHCSMTLSVSPGCPDATNELGKCLASHADGKARSTVHCNKHDQAFLRSWLPHLVISWHVNIGAPLVDRSKNDDTPIKKIHLERRGASHYHPQPVAGRQDCPVLQETDCRLLYINTLRTQAPLQFGSPSFASMQS